MTPLRFVVLWLLMFLPESRSVNDCPWCFGFNSACTFASSGTCPNTATVATNSALVAGRNVAGKVLDIVELIPLRWLRILERVPMQVVQGIARKPRAGSMFSMKATTPLQDILSAISAGQITMQNAMIELAGFVDAASTEAAKADLKEKYGMLAQTKLGSSFDSGTSSANGQGIWTWLWAKISTFIVKGMEIASSVSLLALVTDEGSSGGPRTSNSYFTAIVQVFTSQFDFFEALNLMGLYVVSLGLAAAGPWAVFLEHVVYDTIRRGYAWQFASELLLAMFRRLEDSSGDEVNLGTVYNQSYLNTYMQEAERNTRSRYPNVIFRSHGGSSTEARKAPL